eukprot:14985630-Heterocapsa_arctica.AAC.1
MDGGLAAGHLPGTIPHTAQFTGLPALTSGPEENTMSKVTVAPWLKGPPCRNQYWPPSSPSPLSSLSDLYATLLRAFLGSLSRLPLEG